MASNITTSNIDTNYPVVGNNNSQGFRDNFSNIKSALDVAKSEITDLQLTTAKVNTSTNFNNNIVQNIRLKNSYNLVPNTLTTSSVQYNNGTYQKISISTNTTYTLSGWPAENNYANLRLAITPTTSDSIALNFDAGLGTLKKPSTLSLPYALASTGTYFWELWTDNGGSTVYVQLLDSVFE